ncbi:siderophore-interacting protein [Agrobacterium deltaense]|uniref:siderophore-interacting protein n=1 Tax=Agrobacterium deltaense TaxID=1183412 RepID=UPI001C6DFDC9|nr:siderophore-interacting protein [Agrobacterium deltaense]MBW9075624.1 siderophore-interacting protein [Agrobacterium deltaense]
MSKELNSTIDLQRTAPGNSGQSVPKGGLLERTLTRLIMKPATVIGVTALSDNFRLIDFQSDALKESSWSPGDKVQVKLDGGFITRTYTPISWDQPEGKTQFLAYCHGEGPGSRWAQQVKPGDQRQFFGPRRSMEFDNLPKSVVLCGDETSFALALALEGMIDQATERHYVFEVTDSEEAATVLDKLGLPQSKLIERQPGDAHLDLVLNALGEAMLPTTTFVLSGKASTIQHLNRSLKVHGVETRSLRMKAYWAPGKTGLD